MMKNKIEKYLMNQTEFFSFDSPSVNFTTEHIAKTFHVKRNTISHYINQLVNEKKVLKIKTRPVYFLHKGAFEEAFFPVTDEEFISIDDLFEKRINREGKKDIFSISIGSDGSLKEAIEKMKTAAHYPPEGLPCMLVGSTGSGKSFLARLLHQYSIDNAIIDPEAPLISFNCAQYANNPELLTSNLFGYKKNSFTGAVKDKPGAFVEADGGYLFLDEVHRLSPEGQEKLFTYLDQRKIYPLGETNEGTEVAVRLIFATTEPLKSTFLHTFLRRIPIHIVLPDLNERNNEELKELIVHFLLKEAKQIQKTITITNSVYDLLLNFEYEGNVGELEAIVKYAVATTYSKNLYSSVVDITVAELPQKLIKINKTSKQIFQQEDTKIEVDPNKTLVSYVRLFKKKESVFSSFFDSLIAICENFLNKQLERQDFETLAIKKIESFFDILIFSDNALESTPFYNYIFSGVREVLDYFEKKNSIRFNGNSIFAIAHYLFYKQGINYLIHERDTENTIDSLITYLKNNKKNSYQFALSILHVLEEKTDVPVDNFDQLVFTLYMDNIIQEQKIHYARAVIVAHGYSTASSIANVANRLLDTPIFEAFDMPIDSTVNDIFNEVTNYLEDVDTRNGVVILFDMGSLEQLTEHLNDYLDAPIIIMNNVTTQTALFTGEQIKKQIPFKGIIENVKKNIHNKYQLIYPEKKKKHAIVTTCMTGIGTAIKLQNMLKTCLDKVSAVENYDIIPCDFMSLKNHGKENSVFHNYDVKIIIGTDNPDIKQLPFISLNELISGKGIYQLNKIFTNFLTDEEVEIINEAIVQNFSIERVIESVTILDSKTALDNVSKCIKRYEVISNKRLSNSKKISLYVHICCLIERLVRNAPIEVYLEGKEEQYNCSKIISKLKTSLTPIEEIYNIRIPNTELKYIADILTAKEVLSDTEDDFMF